MFVRTVLIFKLFICYAEMDVSVLDDRLIRVLAQQRLQQLVPVPQPTPPPTASTKSSVMPPPPGRIRIASRPGTLILQDSL